MTIDGYGTVKSLNDGKTALAGKDYILTCKSDPYAFKLIKGKELENYYEVYTTDDTNGRMYIERADLFNRMGGMSFGDCMVDGGIITATPTKDMVRTTVYKEQKGYDNSWWTLCKDGLSYKDSYAVLGFPGAWKGYDR